MASNRGNNKIHPRFFPRRSARGPGARSRPPHERRSVISSPTVSRLFPSVLKSITIIQPETLKRWHRAGFRRPARFTPWPGPRKGGRRGGAKGWSLEPDPDEDVLAFDRPTGSVPVEQHRPNLKEREESKADRGNHQHMHDKTLITSRSTSPLWHSARASPRSPRRSRRSSSPRKG
jgi:hypothetical protein